MSYIFFYDETEHSRVINKTTINAENYYDNFITVFVGWDSEKHLEIEKRYDEFENKYENRKKNGELKSAILPFKQFKYGFSSLSKENIQFINDFFDIFDKDIYLYFSVSSKIEFIVYQLLDNYENTLGIDIDAAKYSLIKAIKNYKPQKVIDSIYNRPDDIVDEIEDFLLEKIENNSKNTALKEKETGAFMQLLAIIEDVDEVKQIDWDYHMPFNGFLLYLDEQGINEYKLIVDQEGSQKTVNAAKDLGHFGVEEGDSKSVFGIRMADFIAGIISKMMKSMCIALTSDCSGLKKMILDDKWFDLKSDQIRAYKKLYYIISKLNDCWYKSYAGVFADDLILLVSFLEYINMMNPNDLKRDLKFHGDRFNSFSVGRLSDYFVRMHNKLPIEPVKILDNEFYYDKRGAKVYIDSLKQPMICLENDTKVYKALNVGVDRNGIPTMTIEENGKAICYRLPEELSEWAQLLVSYSVFGKNLLPSNVMISKRNGIWNASVMKS